MRQQAIVVLLIVLTALTLSACTEMVPPKEYTISDNSVSSITTVVGKRKMYDFSDEIIKKDGMQSLYYRYRGVADVQEDLLAYVDYLQDHSFESLMTSDLSQLSGMLQFGRPATEQSMAFIVTISFSKHMYDVQVDLAEGKIQVYDV